MLSGDMWERVRLFRTYQTKVVPGLRPRESFDITGCDLVTIELLSGFLSLTHPDEIPSYITAWKQLFSIAAHGRAARTLIKDPLDTLDDSDGYR